MRVDRKFPPSATHSTAIGLIGISGVQPCRTNLLSPVRREFETRQPTIVMSQDSVPVCRR